jgi:type III secretion system FlhB-like substrate exporter
MNNAMMVLTTRGETSVAESVVAAACAFALAFFESSPLLHRLRIIELMDNFWCQQYIVGTMICSVARKIIVLLLMLYIV